MKPIVFLIDPANARSMNGSDNGSKELLPILSGLGLPVQVMAIADYVAGTHDTQFSAAIIPRSYNNWSTHYPFAKGTKPFPVWFPNAQVVSNGANYPSAVSVISGLSSTGTAFDCTESGLASICYDSWRSAQLDGTQTKTVISKPGTSPLECLMWETTGAGGSFVLWSTENSEFITGLLYFLKRAGITPPRPYVMYMDMDDISGNLASPTTGYTAGLAALGDMCRARNTLMPGGLRNDDIGNGGLAAVKAVLQSYADVFPLILHDHSRAVFTDDSTYPTVASKLTAYAAGVAEWAAQGLTVPSRGGYYGYSYLTGNDHTQLGLTAIGALGIKTIRQDPSTNNKCGYATYSGTIDVVVTDPASVSAPGNIADPASYTRYQVRKRTMYNHLNYDVTSWAAYIAGDGPGKIAGQVQMLGLCIARNWRHFWGHPPNLLWNAADHSDDFTLGKYWTKVIDPLVAMGGSTVIRYATAADWAAVVRR